MTWVPQTTRNKNTSSVRGRSSSRLHLVLEWPYTSFTHAATDSSRRSRTMLQAAAVKVKIQVTSDDAMKSWYQSLRGHC